MKGSMREKLSWTGFYSPHHSPQEKRTVRACTSEGFTTRHLESHLRICLERAFKTRDQDNLAYLGFTSFDDCFSQFFEHSVLGFAHDILLASTLHLDLCQWTMLTTYNAYLSRMEESESSETRELASLARSSNTLNHLFGMGRVFGQDFDLTGFDQTVYKVQNSLHIRLVRSEDRMLGTDYKIFNVPLCAVPLFTSKDAFEDFRNSKQPFRMVPHEDIENEREQFLALREQYWKALTGQLHPSTSDLRQALVQVKSFERFLH